MNDSLNAVRLDICGKGVDVVLEYKNATGILLWSRVWTVLQRHYGMQRIHLMRFVRQILWLCNQYVHQNGDLKLSQADKGGVPAPKHIG